MSAKMAKYQYMNGSQISFVPIFADLPQSFKLINYYISSVLLRVELSIFFKGA